jgi:hypothetical protein
LEWAYRHLGQDVESPTDGARFWRRIAETRPDQFAAALTQLDQATQRQPEAPAPVPDNRPENEPVPAITKIAQRPQRAKLVFLTLDHMAHLLKGSLRADGIPSDAKCIAASLSRERRGLVLTLASASFPLISEGELIPDLALQFASGR